MAVTKTPRKKPESEETEKPEKKVAPRKTASKPAEKAPAAKKATPKAASEKAAKPKTTRKVKAPAEPAPEPAATPKKADKQAHPAASQSPFVETILGAIREGRALEFIFADSEANAPRTFEPRQLTFDALSQAWYVWGWDRRYNADRFHCLNLLGEVNPVEGVGRAAQGPYAEGTPANQIGGWLGGEPIPVKLTLMKQWVFAVKQAPPAFPNFTLEEKGDGQALVSFTATDLRAIARWVMQFGDGTQVIEPTRLQDRLKQVGATWAGRDRQAAPAPASRQESRPEPRPEPRHESTHEPRRREARPAPPRPDREEEAPKAKPGKLEVIRFDRL